MKIFLLILGLGVLLVLVNAGCAAVRAGYSSAPYQEVRTDGRFQLRDYPALVVVETKDHGDDQSFMRLFHYIDRQNSAQTKIVMTTPVLMNGGSQRGTMSFVLPAALTVDRAPQPTDAQLQIKTLVAGRFAVLRFAGGISTSHETNALTRLQTWLQQSALTPEGGPIYGYFDPP
jgi:DNA gyrase inhibitor GyrI